MRSIRHWLPSLAAVTIAAMIATTAAVGPHLAMSVAADHSLELYWSEQFDYRFFYDPTVWLIEEEWSDLESEYVLLSNGEIFVYYLAFLAPDATTESCLQDVLAEFAADPEILSVEPLAGDTGEPTVENAAGSSVARLVLTIEEAGERYKLVTEETCVQLIPGESVLYVSKNVPAEAYNEIGGAGSFLSVPAIALSVPDPALLRDQTAIGRVPVLAVDGAITGVLDGHLHCVADGPPQLLVGANAVAEEGDFVVDSDAFVLTVDTGEERPAVFGDWLYPEMGGEPSLVLEPGEVGLLWLELSDDGVPYTLSYASDPAAAPEARTQLGAVQADVCAAPGPALPSSVSLD